MEPTDISKVFGQRIRSLRKKQGLTQVEFGEKVGIDKQQISRYERGLETPRPETMGKIIEYGDAPPDLFKIMDQPLVWEIETTETKKLLNNVKEILESGNDTMIEALKHNIKAFLEAIRVTKNQNEDKGGIEK